MNKQTFSYTLLPLRPPLLAYSELYREAYRCWLQVWESVYRKFDIPHLFFSDNFSRQDEVSAIYLEGRCIGVTMHRIVDFSIFDFSRDSYFVDWTSEDIDKLLAHGPKIFLANHLAVDPAFRNFRENLHFKCVFMNFVGRRFLETDCDTVGMITRRDRAVNDESTKIGSTLIRGNADYLKGKDKVDLVAVYRKDVKIVHPEPETQKFCDYLWNNRRDLTHQTLSDAGLRKAA